MKNVKHSWEIFICMDMAKGLVYHMTPKKSENNVCLGELLLRVCKLGCARIGCPFWLSEKSPSVEIDDGLVNL